MAFFSQGATDWQVSSIGTGLPRPPTAKQQNQAGSSRRLARRPTQDWQLPQTKMLENLIQINFRSTAAA
jgi:hypothetical protein